MEKEYDIVIVGAGLVGTSLALALQGQGLRIALLEKNLPQIIHPKKADTRPISLAYASHVVLKTLGVWDDLASQACPIKGVHVSEQGAFGVTHFEAAEMGVPALGYVVPFTALQQRLYHQAVADSNVVALPIQGLSSVHCDDNGASVTIETQAGQQTLTADVLVAADGASSSVREQLNIASEQRDAQEVALTAEIVLGSPHESVAYERFTPNGTLALLPLLDRERYRLVWTMPADYADQVTAWDDEGLLAAVQACFARRVTGMRSIARGAQYPLKTMIAKESIRPGLVLLGNAAHTIYPLAAQGFNLGLRDAATLAEVLTLAHGQNQSLGDATILKSYDDWCKPHQDRIVSLTQGIASAFDLQWPLMTKVRGLGLLAIDLMPPLKRCLGRRTMGLAGRLPKLARGIPLLS